MKRIFAAILSGLVFSTVAYAITPEQIEFCKQEARNQLQLTYQLNVGVSNPKQLMQQAFDRCIKRFQEIEARQNEIDSWQPNQQQQPPQQQQQTPEKKRWFNW